MLEELINLLKTGKTRRIAELAQTLNTTPELVELMLQDLERMGILKRVEGTCKEMCASCPMSTVCATGGGGQLWTMTEEGNE